MQVLDALDANSINMPLPAAILQQYATPAVATIRELSRRNNVEVFTADQAVHGVAWTTPEPRPLAGTQSKCVASSCPGRADELRVA